MKIASEENSTYLHAVKINTHFSWVTKKERDYCSIVQTGLFSSSSLRIGGIV